MKRTTTENLLVHILGSCETTADASFVGTNKTRTLAHNVTSVVTGSIGTHAKFIENLKENKARTNAPNWEQDRVICTFASHQVLVPTRHQMMLPLHILPLAIGRV